MGDEAELTRKVQEVRAKGDGLASWNVKDVQVMASWFKCPGDSKLPTTRAPLVAHYELTRNHVEIDHTTLKPGEAAVLD